MTKSATAAGAAPRYPNVCVKLGGKDANAFSILGVAKAMDEAGVPSAEVDAFMHAAMAGDYDHLLRTVMGWVLVR
jgi:predicted histidine transporter YuiF (NhaC family)